MPSSAVKAPARVAKRSPKQSRNNLKILFLLVIIKFQNYVSTPSLKVMSSKTTVKILLAVIIVMFASNMYTLWYMNAIVEDIIEAATTSLPNVYHATDMNTNVSDYRMREWRHCIATHPDSLASEERAAEEEAERATLHLQELKDGIPPYAREYSLLRSVEVLFTQYLSHSARFFALSRQQEKKEQALAMMYGGLRNEYEALNDELAKLVHTTVANAKEHMRWQQKTAQTTRLILFAVVLGTAIASVSLALFLMRSAER
jgi:methyl-accepting chemotaxis protein